VFGGTLGSQASFVVRIDMVADIEPALRKEVAENSLTACSFPVRARQIFFPGNLKWLP
jgi:hypothetical protein